MLPFTDPILYLIAVVAGFVIQTLLHGPYRMVFYTATGVIAGILVTFSFFLPLAACLGIAIKIAMGKHYHCLVILAVFIGAGYLIGNFILP